MLRSNWPKSSKWLAILSLSILICLTAYLFMPFNGVQAKSGSVDSIKIYRLHNGTGEWVVLWNGTNGWQGEGADGRYVYIDKGSTAKIEIFARNGSSPYSYMLI